VTVNLSNLPPEVVITYSAIGGPPPPTSKNECKHGGWSSLGFRNQGDCVSSVATGSKHPPKGS
jgi:hypothetical protein